MKPTFKIESPGETLLLASFIILSSGLLVHSYNDITWKSARFPIMVLAIVAIFSAAQLVTRLISFQSRNDSGHQEHAAEDRASSVEESQVEEPLVTTENTASWRDVLKMSVWILVFAGVINLVGFSIGIGLTLLAFLYLEAKVTPYKIALILVITYGVYFIAFIRILGLRINELGLFNF